MGRLVAGRLGTGRLGMGRLVAGRDDELGRRCGQQSLELPAHADEFGQHGISPPQEVDELGSCGGRLRVRLVADLRRLGLGRLQDALHPIGEAADHVRRLTIMSGVHPRSWPRSGPRRASIRAMRRAELLRSGVLEAGRGPGQWGYHRKWLALSHLQIDPHPGEHALQSADMFIDLPPVVAAKNDVETRSAGRARLTRHPWPPPGHPCSLLLAEGR